MEKKWDLEIFSAPKLQASASKTDVGYPFTISIQIKCLYQHILCPRLNTRMLVTLGLVTQIVSAFDLNSLLIALCSHYEESLTLPLAFLLLQGFSLTESAHTVLFFSAQEKFPLLSSVPEDHMPALLL